MANDNPIARRDRSPDTPKQALRADGRDAWDKMLGWMRKSAQSELPVRMSKELLDQYAKFQAALLRDEHELVANQLLWNESERDFSRWVEEAFQSFSRIAATVVGRLLAGSGESAKQEAVTMAALSLAAGGSSLKWAEIAGVGRPAVILSELHHVFVKIEDQKLADGRATLPFLDESTTLTVRAHYARVRILAAVCRGTIGRQQAAIIDCWLRTWASDYPIVRSPVAGAYLLIDTEAHHGLRTGQRTEDEHERVLLVEPMAQHIEQVVHWFHEGRIYPGQGPAPLLRVEEHVAALDALRNFLQTARSGLPERLRREECETQVDLYVGLSEVIDRSFGSSAVGGATPVREPAPGSMSFPQTQDHSVTTVQAIDTRFEVTTRKMRLLDESPGGLGFEGSEGAVPLETGTLIAVRRARNELPVLAELVRRVAVTGSPTRFGARVLSHRMKAVTLSTEGFGAGTTALFLAGQDSSGRSDSMLIATSDYDPNVTYEVRFVDRVYRLRLTHIRYRGRGWVLAALEVIDARQAEAKAEIEFIG